MDSNTCWLKGKCSEKHCHDLNGCLILTKLDYLYNEAQVPVSLRKHRDLFVDSDGSDIKAFQQLKAIQDDIVSFVSNGSNLYLFSQQAGNGKTSWSLRLLQAYFNRIWLSSPLTCRALFINVPYFLQALKDNISIKSDYIAHIKHYAANCDLVIWDDISNKTGTEFEINSLLSIIDARLAAGKANIYTSNILPDELKNYLDIRLGSRIACGSACIGLRGGDKRGLHVLQDNRQQ